MELLWAVRVRFLQVNGKNWKVRAPEVWMHPSIEMKKPTKKIPRFCILDILVTIPYWICSRKILNFWPLGCVILKFFFEKVGILIWKKNFRNPIFHYLQLCSYVLWSFFDLKQAKMKICLWRIRLSIAIKETFIAGLGRVIGVLNLFFQRQIFILACFQ